MAYNCPAVLTGVPGYRTITRTDHPGAAMDNESQHTPTPDDESLTGDALEYVSGGGPTRGDFATCKTCLELVVRHPNGQPCP